MDQQQKMTLDRLGCEFGGRICFWNLVDIQKTMLEGAPKEIDCYVQEMIAKHGGARGGFIGKYYPQPHAVGHSKENSEAAFRAFIKHSYWFSGNAQSG